MSYRVVVTDGAVADLAEIDDFISAHDSAAKADHVLDQLEEAVRGLADMPNRGHYPAELSSIGIRDYCED